MHQPSTSFSSSTPLHIASGQAGPSSAASSVVMPGVRPFAQQYGDNGLDPAAESLSRLHEWVGALDRYLRLPNSFQSFSVYLIGLALVFAGATLHVMVAAQIMQAQYRLAELEREYAAIEQQNSELIFMIARDTNLNRMRERALAMGYVPVVEREYVVLPDETQLAAQTAPEPQRADAPQPTQAQANNAATPLRQWERFWRGEVTWEQPVEPAAAAAAKTARSARTSIGSPIDPSAIDPSAIDPSAIDPSAIGEGWQVRWQQMMEQGRNLFTKIDIR